MSEQLAKPRDEVNLEVEKLYIEKEKLKLAKKGWWLDVMGKVGIPASVLVLSAVTYYSGSEMAETRLQFEKDVAQSELLRKDKELFLRSNDSQRASKRLQSEFVEKHQDLILSGNAEDRKRLEQYVQIAFEQDEQVSVLARIEHLRISARGTESKEESISSQMGQGRALQTSNYVERGQAAVRDRKFDDAVIAFRLYLNGNPNDALVWNYLSYAQMRAGQFRDARQSISTAIYHQPSDYKTRQLISINAAKILCSAGDVDEGISYINTAAQVVPGLTEVARKDGELRSRCAGGSARLP
ncbi:tetratricopeptide repeat protein [Achromobacter aloeverae]|uniref:tetratricopeptide repeat protein n=1 Tax=Achromobacter aloeverae TaxID=1750518 RepID=UPI0013017CA1|nr:tetratricopeptide repeat protein [Achromobacter aloeverae]